MHDLPKLTPASPPLPALAEPRPNFDWEEPVDEMVGSVGEDQSAANSGNVGRREDGRPDYYVHGAPRKFGDGFAWGSTEGKHGDGGDEAKGNQIEAKTAATKPA